MYSKDPFHCLAVNQFQLLNWEPEKKTVIIVKLIFYTYYFFASYTTQLEWLSRDNLSSLLILKDLKACEELIHSFIRQKPILWPWSVTLPFN